MFTPAQAIDGINQVFGRHAGFRALHAKGLLCEGTFTATPEAAALTRAGHMQGEPVPVTVRVSNGSGDPNSADYGPDVRGLSVKFYVPDGSKTDIVAQTAPRFPVRTPEAFVEFVQASKPGPEQLLKLPLFLARHPEALPALPANAVALKHPASFATVRYYAVHSYRWVDRDGGERYVRYRFVPESGEEEYISGGDAKKAGRDYLHEEIRERVGRGPVRMALELQIARDDDPVDDPTERWHNDRETLVGGTLEMTGLETGRETGDDVLVFDPTRVTDGIELSNDPILLSRSASYSESVLRRSGVKRAT